MIGINIFTIFQYVSDPDSPTPYTTWFFVLVGACGVLYLAFTVRLAPFPSRAKTPPPTTTHCNYCRRAGRLNLNYR